ncbi:unnamed protein product, partial [Leptidea sinapis]
DRYLAITQSLRQPWIPSRRGACSLLAGIWLISLAIFAPLLAVAAVEREVIPLLIWVERSVEFCTEKWPDTIKKEMFGALSFILVYAVPGCVVVISYSLMGRRLCSVLPPFDQAEGSASSQQRIRLVRERKRVALILLLLAVLFALCWLPYNILQLMIDVNAVQMQGIRQKSNTSSGRTCTTVTFRSSQQGRLSYSPSIQYGKVQRSCSRDPNRKDRGHKP